MRVRQILSYLLLCGLMALSSAQVGFAPPSSAKPLSPEQAILQTFLNADVGQLPLSFVPNAGQTVPQVRYQTHSGGGSLFFAADRVTLAMPYARPVDPSPSPSSDSLLPQADVPLSSAVLHLVFEGANPTPDLAGARRLPGIVNYILGSDPSRWRTNLPTYAGLVYRELYPGVDLRYDGLQGRSEGLLKGTYLLAPGADPTQIRWRYEGADDVRLDAESGDLLVTLEGETATLTERAPVAWQEIDGRRAPVGVRYALSPDGGIGFVLGDYDLARPLTIDPTIQFSTYLGGANFDFGYDIAVDRYGDAYITGRTWSTDYPVGQPLWDELNGSEDAFVTKIDSQGKFLIYSTYYGGSGADSAVEIAVNGEGEAAIVGTTTSNDLPRANPLAGEESFGGGRDVFVAQLNAAGNALLFGTYLGSPGEEYGQGIALDDANAAYVTGTTFSGFFPHVDSLYPHQGGADAFVTKIDLAKHTIVYSTFLGGSLNDTGLAIAVDSTGQAYLAGDTNSADFPAAIIQDSPSAEVYAYACKLEYDETAYEISQVYGARFGGSADNSGTGIAVDGQGRAYVAGITDATDFPTQHPMQAENAGGHDAFVAQLNPAGDALLYSSYLGGSGFETQVGIAVDLEESIYLVGTTASGNFPIHGTGVDNTLGGQFDLFAAKLKADGNPPEFSTYIGGSGIEESKGGAVVYYAGAFYVVGTTTSNDLPIVNPLDNAIGGGADVFVVKLTSGTAPVATIDTIQPNPAVQGQDVLHFQGSGRDGDEGGAYITGYRWNSDRAGLLSLQEDFQLPAAQLASGQHVISFQVRDDEVEWSAPATQEIMIQEGSSSMVRTLILVNKQRWLQQYHQDEVDALMDQLYRLAAHESVRGLVVQVEEDTAVAASYVAWDAEPTSTLRANEVSTAIKALLDRRWAEHPGLEYLVLVGPDEQIPFRRVPDQTHFPESWYESTYHSVSCSTRTGAAFCDNMILTDDYYADREPTVLTGDYWGNYDLYIPDLGTGRLVEELAEVAGQIDTFMAGGEIDALSAIVAGYDFLDDSAQAICNTLSGDGLSTNCTHIGDTWTGDALMSDLFGGRYDLVSLNGHATHWLHGSPTGRSLLSQYISESTADHARALFFSPGCHAGLNVGPANPTVNLDLPQVLAQKNANYVANTGFGIGYSGMGGSEQLMYNLSRQMALGQSVTVGHALVASKHQYYAEEWAFIRTDEKVLIQTTLYGLPMYRYTTQAIATTAAAEEATVLEEQHVTDLGDGLTVNSLSYQFPPLTARRTDDGTYYRLGARVQTDDGQPIQPQYASDVSFPTTAAHGVVFRGGTYVDEAGFDPVVAQAINEYIPPAEPAFDAPTWFPARLHALNQHERGETLVTLLGQFDPNSQTERLYDRLSYDVYYHTTADDWDAPWITYLESALNAGTATISVEASDSSGIHAVVIAYSNVAPGTGTTWSSVELGAGGGTWQGTFPASSATRFYVQAVDGAGNVAVDDNQGRYYQLGEGKELEIYLPLILFKR